MFDDLLPEEKNSTNFDILNPNRKNLNPLLGLNYNQTMTTIIIYLTQLIVAYLFLVIILGFENSINTKQLYWYFSFFIGIGAFVDQLINPDENSKLGYYILLAVYYAIYKFVIFGFIVYLVMLLIGKNYEIKYLDESLPFLTIFVFWALGQKIGYYLEHHRMLKYAEKKGFDSLTDIDKLKIFLYQVHRRSFLKMIIQEKKAKFHNTEFLELSSDQEVQEFTRLVSLDMSKFLKYLKLKILPHSKYVAFEQIKEIDFSKNKISDFSTKIFDIFPNVEKIDLSDNKIKTISDKQHQKIVMLNRHIVINFDGNPVFS